MTKLVRLKSVRRTKALTQQELADIAGLTRSTVARVEGGEEEPFPTTIRKLADALGVRPEDLGPSQSGPAALDALSPERHPDAWRVLAQLVAEGHLTIANETDVIGLVQERPDLAVLIDEASEQLRRSITGARLRLSSSPDPDYGESQELFLGVSTHLGEEEALLALRRFDESWWVHQVGRADGLLCIDLDDDEL